jgi:hypothetical protein
MAIKPKNIQRDKVDNMFFEAMIDDGCSHFLTDIIYEGVSKGGYFAWENNRKKILANPKSS